MATPSIELPKLQEGNGETIGSLVKELELSDYKLPDGFGEKDVLKLSIEERSELVKEHNLLPIEEQKQHFSEFLKNRSEAIRKGEEAVDDLKTKLANVEKSIPQVGVPLTIDEATTALKPIQETLSAVKEGVQELLTPLFTLLSSIPLIGGIFKWLGELFGLNLGDSLKDKAEKATEKIQEKIDEFKGNLNKPKTKEELINQLKETIPTDISKRYGIDFSKEPKKLGKLNELITESYGKLNDDELREFLEKVKDPFKNGIFVKDSFGVLSNIVLTSAFFTFGLVTRGIVDTYDIAFDFAEKGISSVVLTINTIGQAVGIKKLISLEHFGNMVNEMDPETKEKSMALIYREGGLFFSILGGLTYGSYKLLNAFLTDTSANGFFMFGNAMTNNYDKLIRDFGKIEKALGEKATKFGGTHILQDAAKKAQVVQDNYRLLKALNTVGYDKEKLLDYFSKTTEGKELAKKFPDLVKEVQSISNSIPKEGISTKISELAKKEVGKASIAIQKVELKNMWGSFSKNQIGRLNEFYTSINDTLEMQQRLASEGKGGIAKLVKPFEAKKLAHVSRNGDRLTFAFDNVTNFKTWIKELNQAGPEILRGVLGKLPILAIGGMAVTSEDAIASLKKDIWYIIPIVGPIMMIGGIGLDKEGKVSGIGEATMGAALLTFDGYHLIKGGAKGILPYLLKPGVDIYEIARGTTRFSWMTGKAIISSGSSLGSITKEAVEKLKAYKITPKQKQAFAIAMIAMVGYIGYQHYTKDHLSEEEAYNIAKDPNNKDKDTAIVAILETKLKEFGVQNSKIEVNGKEIKISGISNDTMKRGIDYLNKDLIKGQLNILGLTGYEIKFV